MQVRGVKTMSDNVEVVLYVDKSEPSRKLVSEISSKGDGKKIKVVDVDARKLRGWILFEYGTTKMPLMVTSSKIVEGYEKIKKELLG